MSAVDLFGEPAPPPKPPKKPGTGPNGYAWPPGTGPAGETCASCKHRVRFSRWSKCGMSGRTGPAG